ncbi:MAG: arsenate reductase ArsC [Elusimicrobiota bacterium]
MKKNVLFVCIENSCRSQMAEGFAKKWGAHVLNAYSSGSKPSGVVNPRAIQFMKEKEIDLSVHNSKGLQEFSNTPWDYVITMGCGDACPFVPSRLKEDWGISDPKHLPDDGFREIRDQIEKKVLALIEDASR